MKVVMNETGMKTGGTIRRRQGIIDLDLMLRVKRLLLEGRKLLQRRTKNTEWEYC